MGVYDFNLKWALSKNRRKPQYISSNKLLVAYDFFIKTFPHFGRTSTHQFEPALLIGNYCTLPEMSILAVSERRKNGNIHVLRYPEMSKLSTLKEVSKEESFEMIFVGLEFLLLISFKLAYHFELWKWTTGQKTYSLSVPLLESELPSLDFKVNPLWWCQVVIQSNVRLILLEVKRSNEQYYFDLSDYIVEDDKSKVNLLRTSSLQNSQPETKHPVRKSAIQCFCWIPENKVIIASSSGIFTVDLNNAVLQELSHNETSITSMVLSKAGLYVTHETGLINLINVDSWTTKNSIDKHQSLCYAFMSPDCECVAVVTHEGSIVILEVSSGDSYTIELSGAEFKKVVGVGVVGFSLHTHCVVAEEDGSLHVLHETDGSILSSFRIEEGISSLATSPLCSYVLIGSSLGYLYFVDCQNPLQPRIILCERPYDTPIYHLKFDNYGRYAVTSTQNQVIKIWNAVPSPEFRMLGSKKIVAEIKDFAIFCTKSTDSTFIFILAESEPDKSVLIRLQLPMDFHTNFRQYQTDLFGNLSKDALNIKKVALDHFYTKIEIHREFGALLYCPANGAIHTHNAWFDFEKADQRCVLTIQSGSNWATSLNQRWLAVGDDDGGINLYSNNDLNGFVSFGKNAASESIRESRLEFSIFSNNLICLRNNKIMYYRWRENESCLQSIPEWLVYCYSNFARLNQCLLSMAAEEEQGNLTVQPTQMLRDSELTTEKVFDELEACVCVINFKLDQLDDSEVNKRSSSGEFTVDDDCIPALTLENRKRILQIVPQNELEVIKKDLEKPNKDKIDRVSTINVRMFSESYSRSSIDRDNKLLECLHFRGLNSAGKSVPSHVSCSLTLSESVKCKCKEERFSALKSLMSEMCDLKTEFNAEFDDVHDSEADISRNVERSYLEAKMLSQSLPSKAERDFWFASVESSSTLLDSGIGNQGEIASELNRDVIQETKNSIVRQLRSSTKIRGTFDFSVDNLRLKKRYCDYNMFYNEIKIYIILLSEIIEDDFSRWKKELEDGIRVFKANIKDIHLLFKDTILPLEANVKEMSLELQLAERDFSKKIDDKCLKTNLSEETVSFLKKQIPVTRENYSQNPFFRSSLTMNIDDISLLLKEADSQKLCPKTVPKSVWGKMCNKQRLVLIVGALLNHLKNQILLIADTKQSCYDCSLKLQDNVNTMQQALKCISILISKFNDKFQSLLPALDEKPSLDQNLGSKVRKSLSSLPKQGHQLWKDIGEKSLRMLAMNKLLHELEELFGRIRKWSSDLSKKNDDEQDGYLKFMKHVRKRLEEVNEAFTMTKSARGKYVDKHKNSTMKILKSLF